MRLSRLPLSALRAAVCASAALPAALAAQTAKAAPRAMTKPDAEFEESFTQIAGVRELADGRVIVIDQRDKVVKLVDFASGTMTQIGREGSGPNEYSLPAALLAIAGDTTLIYDPLNQRFLVVDPKGKPAGTFSLAQEAAASGAGARPSGPAAGAGGPGGLRLSGGLRGIGGRPKGVDRQGRLYFLSSNLTIGPDGQASRADSAPITRYDRGRKHTDTVAFIKMPQMNIKMPALPKSGDAPTRISISATTNPFDTQDDWVVAPDGRIAVVRGETYRVDWIAPNGARTVGPAIAYDKVKITDADKRAWKENRSRLGGAIQMRTGGPGGQTQSQAVNPRDIPDPTDWPEYKPPFVGSAATIAPDGTVWVARTQAAGAKGELYDLFDGRGQLVGRVTFPNRTRLVGFGKGVAYTVRVDEDDLQYLQRYKL